VRDAGGRDAESNYRGAGTADQQSATTASALRLNGDVVHVVFLLGAGLGDAQARVLPVRWS
jgi:hypothetical protein